MSVDYTIKPIRRQAIKKLVDALVYSCERMIPVLEDAYDGHHIVYGRNATFDLYFSNMRCCCDCLECALRYESRLTYITLILILQTIYALMDKHFQIPYEDFRSLLVCVISCTNVLYKGE